MVYMSVYIVLRRDALIRSKQRSSGLDPQPTRGNLNLASAGWGLNPFEEIQKYMFENMSFEGNICSRNERLE